jgi:hypothetical protein
MTADIYAARSVRVIKFTELVGKLPTSRALYVVMITSGLIQEYPWTYQTFGRLQIVWPCNSGLLNCLDGHASVDGRLLLMTSNSPDSLDAALVRPGQCDKMILFGYICLEVTAGLCTHIFTRTATELYRDEKSASYEYEIPAMAVQFASRIPTDAAITPAEAQAWLLSNRTDPVAALRGAAEWAKDIVETKLRGANVANCHLHVRHTTHIFQGSLCYRWPRRLQF